MRRHWALCGLWLVAIACMAGEVLARTGTAWIGAEFKTVTDELAKEHDLAVRRGALVTDVSPGGPAAKDLRKNDVIMTAGGKQIRTAEELTAIIDALQPGAALDLVRNRDGDSAKVTVTLAAPPAPPAPPVVAAAGAAPQLMVDTGGHMALIRTMTFTPDGKQIVSAGDDKVVRVWDVETGTTVRTFRGEAELGEVGKIYALAVSPDGRWLATGGPAMSRAAAREAKTSPHLIRLYDFPTGRLVRLLRGHGDIIVNLAFSSDSRRLISGSADETAMIWDVASGRSLVQLTGHTSQVFAVGLSHDGERAVTGGFDKTLRLWRLGAVGADGRLSVTLIREMKEHRDKVHSLAVSRDGRIASGAWDGEVRIWDGRTGLPLAVHRPAPQPAPPSKSKGQPAPKAPSPPEEPGLLTNLGRLVIALAFSPDGRRLLAGTDGAIRNNAFVLDPATGTKLVSYPFHDNSVPAVDVSPDGQWAATGGGDLNVVHVWRLDTGARRTDANGRPLNLAGIGQSGWAVGISPDGRRIAWGTTRGRAAVGASESSGAGNPLEHHLRLPAGGESLGRPELLSRPGAPAATPSGQKIWAEADFVRFRPKHGNLALTRREGGNFGYLALLDLHRDGKLIATLERGPPEGYRQRSFTFSPDGRTIISGAGVGFLEAFDVAEVEAAAAKAPDGIIKSGEFNRLARPFIGHEGSIWDVVPSPDGRFLLSTSDDQTLRLWNLATRELIVTMFHGAEDRWAIWTPQGFYAGDGGLVGWQLNNGPEQAASYVRGQQLRNILNRPDIVERAIVLASSSAAARELAPRGFDLAALMRSPPPVIQRISAPTTAVGGRTRVTVTIAPSAAPLGSIDFHVTGPGKAGETKVTAQRQDLPAAEARLPDGSTVHAFEVPLFAGVNSIRATARSASGESDPQVVRVQHNGEGALDTRGTLWVLAVGVDSYPTLAPEWCGKRAPANCNLAYAGNDARAFATTAEAAMRASHTGSPNTTLLVDGPGGNGSPTRANILEALARIQAKARDNDTIMVFLAGHGENWTGGRYHFLPSDLVRTRADDRGSNMLDWADDIQSVLARAKGRKVLFLDACHSGNAYNKTLLTAADADRFVAYSAAAPDELAQEDVFQGQGHGAFTYVLLQGLKGNTQAIDPLEQAVTVYRLGEFLNVEVRRLTRGAQTPEYRSGQGNFALVRR